MAHDVHVNVVLSVSIQLKDIAYIGLRAVDLDEQ